MNMKKRKARGKEFDNKEKAQLLIDFKDHQTISSLAIKYGVSRQAMHQKITNHDLMKKWLKS